MISTCEALEISFVPWNPLGMGYLTGKVTPSTPLDPTSDLRARFPCFTAETRRVNRPVVDLLQRIADREGATAGQASLAWLLALKPWIVPIPGIAKLEHLEENLRALNLELTAEGLSEIEDGFSRIQVHGSRATEDLLAITVVGAKLGTRSIDVKE